MTLNADILADRRGLKRQLRVWRIAAVLITVTAIFAMFGYGGGKLGLFGHGDHIARITVSGIIVDDREQQEMFDALVKEDSVKAIILHIDSPGGTTAGAEALYAAIRRAASKKPLVAVVGDVAASGGYIAALGGDHIVARGNSITGSIGVIFQWADVSELLDTLGVTVNQLKSSELKAEPGMFGPAPEAALEITRVMVSDSYEWFVGLVSERRPFDEAAAREVSDGRVYTGRQALEAGLIDAIGGERTALQWLRDERQVGNALKVVDWSDGESEDFSLADLALSRTLAKFGLEDIGAALGLGEKTAPIERLSLDGLISVWHPDL